MTRLVVVGSINVDTSIDVQRLPILGETMQVSAAHRAALGGKGANQAVAAARLGADVTLLGLVGSDDAGTAALAQLAAEGVQVAGTRRSDRETGRAFVLRGPGGESTVLLAAGANGDLSAADVDSHNDVIGQAKCVLIQQEISGEAVEAAARSATELLILNPAPARPVSPEVLRRVDILIPNRVELLQLVGADSATTTKALVELAGQIEGPRAVIVTLGADGCLIVEQGGAKHLPAEAAVAVDTTAAGDSFCGALATALLSECDLEEAARYAQRVAAIAVSRLGASNSLPYASEVEGPPPAGSLQLRRAEGISS